MGTRVWLGLVGLVAAAGVAWVAAGTSGRGERGTVLLNVSYDPTRELWRDLNDAFVARYEQETGLAVLINTSFNVHEEPIINAPEECVTALRDNRVDAVVTERAVWAMPRS